ncbi:MAG: GHKL domain-containing protein [Lachnospiraceae bacterium]|nr:GHKL domain-containing protein [Lachnospiraceae bacterium]
MIRSLRRKFILLAMASLIGTMIVLCTAIGIVSHCVTVGRMDRAISLLHQNGGSFLPPGLRFDPSDFHFQVTPETPFETRYFVAELTDRQEIRFVSLEHIAALDGETAADTIRQVIETGKTRGYVEHYRFGVFPKEEGGSIIIVLDCFLQLQAANNILRICVSVALACALTVFVLILLLSRRVIRPFVENLERQRQFVTDASHELKTPLAVLRADLGLLEDSLGENKWLESAQAQIVRLDRLIKNLVELARTEETIREDAVAVFSVSEIAQANVDAFQPLAEAEGKILKAKIAAGINLKGVQDNFFRLFSILLDNAVKYCDPQGTINLSVFQRGRNVCICVSNPSTGIDPAQLSRYFDRFYRADSSRARSTGGYGIGLSTAKAIVTRHRGRIANHYTDGIITFTALIPQAG